MAFPTSSLTNNQVHKEGNRAFVYDSALGVWDQVRETDRTENKILSGEISGAVTGGSGLTGHARIGDSARSYLTSPMANQSGETFLTGFTNDFNDNTAIFAHHADGLKVLISGTYLCTWSLYTYSQSTSSPINENYCQFYLTYKNNGSPDNVISKTYMIYTRPHDGDAYRYNKLANAHTIQLNANDVIAMKVNQSSGNAYYISAGTTGSFLVLTYLSEHS
jgi:hypothetical protein